LLAHFPELSQSGVSDPRKKGKVFLAKQFTPKTKKENKREVTIRVSLTLLLMVFDFQGDVCFKQQWKPIRKKQASASRLRQKNRASAVVTNRSPFFAAGIIRVYPSNGILICTLTQKLEQQQQQQQQQQQRTSTRPPKGPSTFTLLVSL